MCPTNNYKVDILQKNGVKTKEDIQFNAQWISNNSDIRKNNYIMLTYSFDCILVAFDFMLII